MEMETRFWTVLNVDADSVEGWFGVCDERAGGIVAYFAAEAEADAYRDAMANAEIDQAIADRMMRGAG